MIVFRKTNFIVKDKHMKKIIPLALLLISSISTAGELSYYDDIEKAVMAGKTIHIAINFSKCSLSTMAAKFTLAQSVNMAVFTPNVLLIGNNSISTSLLHFTMDNPRFRIPVYEFIKYKISNDNTVHVNGQVLEVNTRIPLSNLTSAICTIGSGARIYS
jgi:hypothetical protein